MSSTELVPSVSVENMVNQRAGVLQKFEAGLRLLQEAAHLASAANIGFPTIGMNCRHGRDLEERITGHSPTALVRLVGAGEKVIDAEAWAYLMNESGMLTFMDTQARREWSNKVHERDVPPLTFDNVAATFATLQMNRGEIFDRGVINVFRSLSWDYKTNQPFKFGKRLVLTGLIDVMLVSGKRWLRTRYESMSRLDDLDRVFHLLDDKPEPDHRKGWNERLRPGDGAGEVEGPYFAVRWFLNGNGHVIFRRPDLVDRMNRILSKHFPLALASEVR